MSDSSFFKVKADNRFAAYINDEQMRFDDKGSTQKFRKSCKEIIDHIKHNDQDRELISFSKGEYVIEEGMKANKVYIQCTGVLKLVKNYDKTNPIIISFAKPCTMVGMPSALLTSTYEITAIAVEKSTGYFINPAEIMHLIFANPISKELIENLAEDITSLHQRVASMASKKGAQRVISVVGMLIATYEMDSKLKLKFKISIKELAEMVVMSRETLHRILRELEDTKVLSLKNKTLQIIDLDKFSNLYYGKG